MRDILPIAVFEQTQISNWQSHSPSLSAYDICDKTASYRSQFVRKPVNASQLLDAKYILEINSMLASSLDGCEAPEFKKLMSGNHL